MGSKMARRKKREKSLEPAEVKEKPKKVEAKEETEVADAKEEPEEVDYGATADAIFEQYRSDEDNDNDVEDNDDEDNDDEDNDDDNNDDDDNDEKNTEDNDPTEDDDDGSDEDADAKVDGDENRDSEDQSGSDIKDDSDSEEEEDANDDDDDDEKEEEDKAEDAPAETVDIKQPTSANGEPCTFDLRNMLAMNSHQVNVKALYAGKKKEAEKVSIPRGDQLPCVDEEYLLEKALDGCAQIVAALWQLPKEKSDAGTMVSLPKFDESRVPRALPPPEPKKETKWEKFAKERGLPLNKNKRSRKVWDEATGSWMYRHGYEKANNDGKEWPILEVKANEDPYADPWEKLRDAKRQKIDKNVEQRMRNQERAGVLAKGTTSRYMKGLERSRKAGKQGGNQDRDNVSSIPVGVPVDLKPNKLSGPMNPLKRGKESTVKALLATQRSTASMGRFDKMREDEPERKKATAGLKQKHYELATDKKVIQSEREKSLKIMKLVVDGGGVAKERDIRKGKYANGETAYDYEFNDGLGASTFRKRKGRAGAGKAKKMTKKRAK